MELSLQLKKKSITKGNHPNGWFRTSTVSSNSVIIHHKIVLCLKWIVINFSTIQHSQFDYHTMPVTLSPCQNSARFKIEKRLLDCYSHSKWPKVAISHAKNLSNFHIYFRLDTKLNTISSVLKCTWSKCLEIQVREV